MKETIESMSVIIVGLQDQITFRQWLQYKNKKQWLKTMMSNGKKELIKWS